MPYYVYIITNHTNTTLYIGMTSNLQRRIWEHKTGFDPSCFTHKYNCKKLVYVEEYQNVKDAIAREKTLKRWKRAWKDKLISDYNPDWRDLSKEE